MKVFLHLFIALLGLNKDDPCEKAEEDSFNVQRHFSAAETPVVNVEGDHSHRASEGHQADGHSVVQC